MYIFLRHLSLKGHTKLGKLNLVIFYQLFLYYIAGVEPLWDQVVGHFLDVINMSIFLVFCNAAMLKSLILHVYLAAS